MFFPLSFLGLVVLLKEKYFIILVDIILNKNSFLYKEH